MTDIRNMYLEKIAKIPTVSFNKEQKEIARRILENTKEEDLDAVYGLITQRVKTGFVFDEAPEVNHNAVALVKENPRLNINVNELNVTEHKLIIGENYDALKNLCATYIDGSGKGLIDVIYIDPPYNTEASKSDGNDYKEEIEATKFIYRDKFTRDGWLNMMNERLKLAKRLLSDKGVIFISIDDSEQAYLKVLCDEIFGEENFVYTLPTIMNLKGNQDEFAFAGTHEYTIVYTKNKLCAKFNEFAVNDEDENNWQIDDIGYWKKGRCLKASGINAPREARPNLFFPIYINKNTLDFTLDEKAGADWYHLIPLTDGKEMSWYWSQEKFINDKNEVIVRKTGDSYTLYKKQRPSISDLPSHKPKTLFYKPEYSSGNGTNLLKKILGSKVFNNPKPVQLLKDFIFLASSKSSTILDFFAGSGTTGQAVMELNAEDGGNRRFILVTNNENGIGENITRERLYRVINGKGSKGEAINWKYKDDMPCLQNNSVRVFNLETEELNLNDLEKAEKLKETAKTEFKKLNENYNTQNDFDIYNELSALNPHKKDAK